MRKRYFVLLLFSGVTCLCAEESKRGKKEDPSVVVREEIIGNVKVTAEARNIDEASRLRAEWRSQFNKKRRSEQDKERGSEKKDEEEDDSSSVSIKFKWPARG